jgi:RNA polymerase sigma-70 factor (ECF subfamily)
MSNIVKSTRYSSLSLKEVVLLCAGTCDNEAWEEFTSRVGKPLAHMVMRTASLWGNTSRALVEDLVQAIYLKLWEGGRHLLRDFALQRPDAILGYLKKTAANATHDYFKHSHTQSAGADNPHVSTSDLDPDSASDVEGHQENADFTVLLNEIDEHLKRCLRGPDRERDRTIFWLYFRQGMSSKEIASLPGIGLGAKGVGSVIERIKHSLREQILGTGSGTANDELQEKAKSLVTSY